MSYNDTHIPTSLSQIWKAAVKTLGTGLVIYISLSLACQTHADDEATRQAVPDKKIQVETLELVRSVFEDDYAKRAAEDRQALAMQLLEHSAEAKDEPAQLFVLLREAQSIAADIGDVATAQKAVDALCEKFDVDDALQRAEVYGRLLETVRVPADKKRVVGRCLEAVELLVDADRFEEAKRLSTSADRAAASLRDKDLVLQARKAKEGVVSHERTYSKVQPFVETLAKNPEDETANYVVGRYRCFHKGQWTTGLPMLAKGSSPVLKELAQATLEGAVNVDQQYSIAQKWWDAAGKLKGRERDQIQLYAADWYRHAVPELTALRKANAEKRIEQTEELAAKLQKRRVVNLLKLVDVATYGRPADKWTMQNGALVCTRGSFVPKVVIPYEPPEEYDFKIVFSQPKLRNPVCMIMPKNGASFSWEVGGTNGQFAFSIEPPSGGKNPVDFQVKGAQQPGRVHTTIVQVRNGGVRAFYDGRPVAQYATDYSDMKTNSWRDIREKNFLAVGCDDPAIFHVIELTEVRGRGRHVKETP